MRKAEQIICPAPMPENPVDAHVARLLVPAPHVVLEKKAKKVAAGTRKSSRRLVVSDSSPDNPEAPSASEDEEKEEEEASPPPMGGGKKRMAAPSGEVGGSKKGKTLSPDYSTDADDGGEKWAPRAKPLAKS